MSLELKVNNTVSKLIEKYEGTGWNGITSKILNDQHFRKVLSTLMENHTKGISFQPGFNQIFKMFDDNMLLTTKVVVVYPNATDPIPHYEGRDHVMIVRTPLTISEGVDNASLWAPFIKQLLDEIAYRSTKTIFVFVGKHTEKYKDIVRKGQYKFFVPENPEFDISKVHNAINDLLKKTDYTPINW
jgi:uracil DNA glycosylase